MAARIGYDAGPADAVVERHVDVPVDPGGWGKLPNEVVPAGHERRGR
jgi:hypothetical protein